MGIKKVDKLKSKWEENLMDKFHLWRVPTKEHGIEFLVDAILTGHASATLQCAIDEAYQLGKEELNGYKETNK